MTRELPGYTYNIWNALHARRTRMRDDYDHPSDWEPQLHAANAVVERLKSEKDAARLIAAAPELLKALKAALTPIMQSFENFQERGNENAMKSAWEILQQARAAIAKAEGK